MNICCITSNPQVEYIEDDLEKIGDLRVYNKQKLSADEVALLAHDADILIIGPSGVDRISPDMIDQLPNLKLISLLTVGYDWVDVSYAKSKDIAVCNIKGANSESVAEQSWGMIIDLAKRITEFNKDAEKNGACTFGDYKGKEIYGKTLGVIGLGDIGKKIARCAKGFNMKVLGVNKSGLPVDGVELVSLETLLTQSDVIAVATPLNSETKNLISKPQIDMMKTGAILVNCAREEIVNKTAMIEAVRNNKLFGYGVETAIMTPIPKNDPYFSTRRIIAIPHNAFNTEDADKKSYDLVLANIKAYLAGKPQHVVN
jgi:phosphoglycerate dehydrogenase-like enzyme